MIRLMFLVLTCCALAACETAIPRGEQVPVRQLIAEARGTPFTCSDYDPASDTCEGIGTFRVRGDVITYRTDIAVNLQGAVIPLRVTGQEVIRGADSCVVPGSFKSQVRVPELPRQMAEFIEEIFDSAFREVDNYCASYFRGVDGGYVQVARDAAGREQPEASSTFRYFKTRKSLRPIAAES